MLAPQINDHVAQALARLLQQYQGRPLLAALVSALVQPLQDLEDAIYPIDRARQITNPDIGSAQLDGMGQIIGLERNGLGDAEYLIFLFGKIGVNFSDTTVNRIASIAANFFGSPSVQVENLNRMAVGIQVAGTIDKNIIALAAQLLQSALGAAIELDWIAQFDPTMAFAFAGGTQPALGFGDALNPQSDSGGFADVVWFNPIT